MNEEVQVKTKIVRLPNLPLNNYPCDKYTGKVPKSVCNECETWCKYGNEKEELYRAIKILH